MVQDKFAEYQLDRPKLGLKTHAIPPFCCIDCTLILVVLWPCMNAEKESGASGTHPTDSLDEGTLMRSTTDCSRACSDCAVTLRPIYVPLVSDGSSLTAATYIAIGNLFRKLWGKEAGWAHSVLFTADLKAFAERTVAKTEIKEEEVVVKIESEDVVAEVFIKKEIVKRKIKTEPEDVDDQVLEVKEVATRRSKRQRA
jgi:hypothetical protein